MVWIGDRGLYTKIYEYVKREYFIVKNLIVGCFRGRIEKYYIFILNYVSI